MHELGKEYRKIRAPSSAWGLAHISYGKPKKVHTLQIPFKKSSEAFRWENYAISVGKLCWTIHRLANMNERKSYATFCNSPLYGKQSRIEEVMQSADIILHSTLDIKQPGRGTQGTLFSYKTAFELNRYNYFNRATTGILLLTGLFKTSSEYPETTADTSLQSPQAKKSLHAAAYSFHKTLR